MSEITKLQNEEDLNYQIMVAEKHLADLKDKLTKYKAKCQLRTRLASVLVTSHY